MPAAPGNPFHSYLDAQGRFAFSTPPGIFPSGFHLEGVVVLIEPSGALQVTPVAEVNF